MNKTLGSVPQKDFGFSEVIFDDELGEKCAIQTVTDISCILDESKPKSLLLGLKVPHCYIDAACASQVGIEVAPDDKGIVEFDLPQAVSINASMRLNEDQVKGLIKRLEQWLDTGQFSDEDVK